MIVGLNPTQTNFLQQLQKSASGEYHIYICPRPRRGKIHFRKVLAIANEFDQRKTQLKRYKDILLTGNWYKTLKIKQKIKPMTKKKNINTQLRYKITQKLEIDN